jgi:hypothetical protein
MGLICCALIMLHHVGQVVRAASLNALASVNPGPSVLLYLGVPIVPKRYDGAIAIAEVYYMLSCCHLSVQIFL